MLILVLLDVLGAATFAVQLTSGKAELLSTPWALTHGAVLREQHEQDHSRSLVYLRQV
jgi:hypothetical protein